MINARPRALVIASAHYKSADLYDLPGALADAEQLAEVLGDAERGGFSVQLATDETVQALRVTLEEFFLTCDRDDLLLLHFSGHGRKSESGRLHLAARDTRLNVLKSTSIDAPFLRELLARSPARQKVVLLDCCYGGAFSAEEAAGEIISQRTAVLTAAGEIEPSFDATDGDTTRPSLFTDAVVRGLQGGADIHGEGIVTLSSLHAFVSKEVTRERPEQEPGFSCYLHPQEIILADVPDTAHSTIGGGSPARTRSFRASRDTSTKAGEVPVGEGFGRSTGSRDGAQWSGKGGSGDGDARNEGEASGAGSQYGRQDGPEEPSDSPLRHMAVDLLLVRTLLIVAAAIAGAVLVTWLFGSVLRPQIGHLLGSLLHLGLGLLGAAVLGALIAGLIHQPPQLGAIIGVAAVILWSCLHDDPTEPLGTTVRLDNTFDSSTDGWSGSGVGKGISAARGELVLRSTAKKTVVANPPRPLTAHVNVVVQLQLPPSAIQGDGVLGIRCRQHTGSTGQDFYRMALRDDGYSSLEKSRAGKQRRLRDWEPTAGLRFDTQNDIRMACYTEDRQVRLELWVNGTRTISATDADHPLLRGPIGLDVAAATEHAYSARVDRLTIRDAF